jgi:branched-chain amino acid transport system permease protein
MAIREDELAAGCMGLNPVRVKLSAFAMSAPVAALAGVLYASKLTLADPGAYDFQTSIMALCVVIIGGLGSIQGVLVGAFVLIGFDNVLSPMISGLIQKAAPEASGNVFLTFSSYRWLIFGVALVLMMRFRPEGILPSRRVKAELHHEEDELPGPAVRGD